MMRFATLGLLLGLAACANGGTNPMVSSTGSTTPPAISTADLAPKIGCTHIARLLNDQNAPVTDVLRRRSECPPAGTPGWIEVRDESAFQNYEGIGRSVRGLPPPRPSA